MQGQRIGYIRVSSFDQNPERQLEHIQVDKVFIDKASGKDTQRPQLDVLLSFVREGDTVVVHSMDRLARNLDDLRRRHCCKVSDEAAFCLIQRPYISKTLL
ncbi:recombinase family protein, partial [Escherichia coli]|uniref:recombinase family protein n=1 Tax=Escherichia coli TaxID=562 RepID=UPI00208DCD83